MSRVRIPSFALFSFCFFCTSSYSRSVAIKKIFLWFWCVYGGLLLFVPSCLLGESIGGPLWSTNPCRGRVEVEGGALFPRLAPFTYGLTEDLVQNPEDYITNHPTQGSGYVNARGSYGLPCSRIDFPLEIYGCAGIYRAEYRATYDNDSSVDGFFVFEPRIDGNNGVGLGPEFLAIPHSSLGRTLLVGNAEAGIRQRFCRGCCSFFPGIFVLYQRMQQNDQLKTSSTLTNLNPGSYYMKLASHTNSDRYGAGINFHFSRPLFSSCSCLTGTVSVSGEWMSALYHGRQTYDNHYNSGAHLNLSAFARDQKYHVGFSTGAELGARLFVIRTLNVSLLGNVRYTTLMPYVNYHNQADNLDVPASLAFTKQLTYGGVVNLSLSFKQGRLKLL